MATTGWVAGNSELSLGPGNLYVATPNSAQNDWASATYTALGGCSSAVLRDIRSFTDLTEAQKGTSWADRVLTGSNSEIEYSLTRPFVERIELVGACKPQLRHPVIAHDQGDPAFIAECAFHTSLPPPPNAPFRRSVRQAALELIPIDCR